MQFWLKKTKKHLFQGAYKTLNIQNKAKKKPGNVLISPYGYNRRYGA